MPINYFEVGKAAHIPRLGRCPACHVGVTPFLLLNVAHKVVIVPPEVRANYIGIIDSILAESDLSRISEKKVRQGIQAKVEYDITPQKVSSKH